MPNNRGIVASDIFPVGTVLPYNASSPASVLRASHTEHSAIQVEYQHLSDEGRRIRS